MVGALYAIAFAFPFFMLVDTGRPVLAMLALALAQGGSVGIMFGVQGVILLRAVQHGESLQRRGRQP